MRVKPAGLLERIELEGIGPAERMAASLAPGLNLFTGDNGLGKSFMLEVVWRTLTGLWVGKPALTRSEAGGSVQAFYAGGRKRTERFERGREIRSGIQGPKIDCALYLSSNGESSICFLKERLPWPFPDLDAGSNRRVLLDFDFADLINISVDDIFNGTRSGRDNQRFQGLIADWSLWQYKDDPDFSVFCKVVRALSPEREPISLGEPKRIARDDSREIPTLVLPYGEVPITHASAGMKRIVSLAYLLVWTIREHRFIAKRSKAPVKLALVIDEIEAHLHPAWQRLILPALFAALEALPVPIRVQMFVTTHSPMVMASTETLCREPDDGLFLFELEEGRVTLSPQPWEKQGDASAWLTSDLFGLGEARNKPAEELAGDLDKVMDAGLLSDKAFRDLDRRVADLLPEEDPLRARWTVWKLKREGRL